MEGDISELTVQIVHIPQKIARQSNSDKAGFVLSTWAEIERDTYWPGGLNDVTFNALRVLF